MDVAFEIYTFGGGEFLRMVFQGVVNILDSRAFHTLMAVVALVGFLITLGQGATNPKKFNHFWILMLAGIYISVVIPRTDIQITDTIITESSAIVSNVPIIVAVPAAFFSQVSMWITDRVEDQFSLPNEISYTNTGYLLGHALLAEMNAMKFPDERVRNNFDEFWRACVFYDIALGQYSWREMVRASEKGGAALVEFISNNTSQVRMFPYTPKSNPFSEKENTRLLVCRESWLGDGSRVEADGRTLYQAPMAKDLKEQTDLMYRKGSFKFFNEGPINLDVDLSRIITKHAAVMPVALSFYTKISESAADLASTTILGNSLRNGLSGLNSVTDVEGATQEFALNKAQLERGNTFAVMGRVASKFLPMLKNIFGALIYALAPVAILMLMLPMPGKVMIGYLKVLLWINLWDPFYAILHCIMSFYSSSVTRGMSMAEAEGNGDPKLMNVFSFVSFTRYSEVMNEHALLAGYLALSVPMMAWMVVQMSGAMMAGLAGRTMQGYEGTVTRASNEITSGNISMGTMNFGNHSVFQDKLAPNMDSHRTSRYNSSTANLEQHNSHGFQVNTADQSKLVSEVNVDKTAQKLAQTAHSDAVAIKDKTASDLEDAQSGVRNAAQSLIEQRMHGRSTGSNASTGESGDVADSYTRLLTALHAHADKQGMSQEERNAFIKEGGMSVTVGARAFGNSVGFSGGAKTSNTTAGAASTGEESQQGHQSADKFDELRSNVNKALLAEVAATQDGHGDTYSDALSGSLLTLKTARENHSIASEREESTQNILSQANNDTGAISTNYNDTFNLWAAEEYNLSSSKLDDWRSRAQRGNAEEREEYENRMQFLQKEFLSDRMGLMGFQVSPANLDKLQAAGVAEVQQFFQENRGKATAYGHGVQAAVREKAAGTDIKTREEIGDEHFNVFNQATTAVESTRLSKEDAALKERILQSSEEQAPFDPRRKGYNPDKSQRPKDKDDVGGA